MRLGVGARCDVHSYSLIFQESLDSENVISVADRDAATHVVFPQDHSHSLGGFRRIRSVGFSDQTGIRNPAAFQIIVANSAFAKGWISGRAAGRDNHRGHTALEE